MPIPQPRLAQRCTGAILPNRTTRRPVPTGPTPIAANRRALGDDVATRCQDRVKGSNSHESPRTPFAPLFDHRTARPGRSLDHRRSRADSALMDRACAQLVPPQPVPLPQIIQQRATRTHATVQQEVVGLRYEGHCRTSPWFRRSARSHRTAKRKLNDGLTQAGPRPLSQTDQLGPTTGIFCEGTHIQSTSGREWLPIRHGKSSEVRRSPRHYPPPSDEPVDLHREPLLRWCSAFAQAERPT